MARSIRTLLLVVIASLAIAGTAQARGGNYVFSGGTPAEQHQVTAALDASAFDWSLVPQQITVRIDRGLNSEATRGMIRLDADLLDAGQYSWGVVQHEYAHQVDFFLLGDTQRAQLLTALGGSSWWQNGKLAHAQLASERFASTLAWAYWQSAQNVMKPNGPGDEGGSMPPAVFRQLVQSILGGDVPPASTLPTTTPAASLPTAPSHAPALGKGRKRR
jgi:hypothetical protein